MAVFTDTVFINAAIETDTAVQFVLKHELTHSIEGTSMWNSLRRVIRQEMGDAAFSAAVERVQNNRAAVGEALDAAGAEKEVVANFVGNNLFTENFAEAITRQDTKLSSVFAGTFYRLRYAMDAIKNGKQAARMQYAERLFTVALDKTPGTVHLNADADTEGEVQYQLDENFGEQLQDWLEENGKAHGSFNGKYFVLGTTPDILIKHGAKNVPVIMYPECVEKVAGGKGDFGHDIDLNELAKLPAELNNPVLLFRGSIPNSLVALTELKNKNGHDIIAAIHCSAYEGRTEITKIASVYSKTNARNENKILGYVDKQVQRGNLIDGNIEKASRWFTRQGLQLPELVQTTLEANTTVSQNTGDVNSQYMQNSENDARGGVQHSFIRDEDGNTIVKADRDVLSGNDRKEWIKQVSGFFNESLLKDGSLTVESTEGQTLRITKKETLHKNRDQYKQQRGKRKILSDNEFFVKMQALSHVDELAQAGTLQRNADGSIHNIVDTKNHPFAADGFVYSDVLFENADGTRYAVTMSIGMKDGVGTVYNVGKIKGPMQRQTPQKSRTSDRFVGETGENSGSMHTSTFDTTVSQNTGDVNSQYMQNSEKNTQRAVAGESETDITLRENTAQQENATQQENTQESTVHEDTAQRTETPERAGANAYSDDYYTATRQEDAVNAMLDEAERTASFDSEEELSPLEEVTQETQRRKAEKRTKFQEKQAAERADLVRRFKNGTLSEEEYDAALAKLTDEAVERNDKERRRGTRGTADEKKLMGELFNAARDTYIKPIADKELKELRAKRQAAEEKRTRKAAEIDLEKKLNEAEARVLHPQKGRRIPARHAETMLKLLRTISVAVEDKQRYIADRREKLGDAVYPGTQSRYENEIQKAMESGRALSKQFDEMLLLYKDLAKDDGLKSAYAPELDAALSDFTERIRDKSISEMTTEDLTYGAALVGAVMHCEEYAQTFPAEVFGEECTVAEMMPQLLQELRENASELPRALKNFKTLWSDPIAVCNMLGGYHKDSKWVKLGKYLVEESTYREMEVVAAYNNLFLESAQDAELMKGLRFNKKNRVDGINLVDAEGNAP